MGYGAFSGCASLGEVTLPESVRSVGGAAFARCASLAAVTLPEGLETIEYSTFRDCAALTALSIPQGVKKIGSRAFEKCVSLRSAVIPRSVERLEEGAFSGCTALSDVAVLGRPQVEKGVFSGCPIATFDTVPAEAIPPETVAALLGKPFGEVPASLKRCYRPADAALEGAVEVEGLGFFALLPCGEEEWPFVVSACGEWIKVKETEYGLDTSMTELGFGGVTEETAKIDPLPWECLIAEGEVFGLYWEGRPYLFAEAGRVYEVDESTDGVREDTVEVDITRTYIQKR